jgi:hypothetical protein
MTRLRGWAPKGERLVDKIPQGKWRTATFLAALRNDRIDAPGLFDGPINGQRFRAYVDQFLVPTLKPGDVVVLDNLGSHKGKVVRKAIRSRIGVGAWMMAGEFWVERGAMGNDRTASPEEPAGSAQNRRSARDQRNRSRLKTGCRWQDCPSVYGPPTTILQSVTPPRLTSAR